MGKTLKLQYVDNGKSMFTGQEIQSLCLLQIIMMGGGDIREAFAKDPALVIFCKYRLVKDVNSVAEKVLTMLPEVS